MDAWLHRYITIIAVVVCLASSSLIMHVGPKNEEKEQDEIEEQGLRFFGRTIGENICIAMG